ncbi:penicillin-binding transpeptidase domain-containing protein [Lachnoclostridium sp. An181]|uniref:penicillin-binding transpeptidase domain-containing protein n=1 Tax=Lachnoclostridium sp. An181 TaxID=1965575 RepID=UPI000B3880D6|nr:penicillin-binding transpeptidase domain-containing protein [Lachnoclostridium sp. An181]OUP51167.1 hypothetical protein B5F18_00150 [Lachnoclostridium sp. An181]
MKNIKIPRSFVLLILFIILFLFLIARLFHLQIVKGKEYAENFKLKTKREITLLGTRGNIYDRNGKPLARNKLAYSVTFEDSQTYGSERERQLSLNSKIYKMNRIIRNQGGSVENSLKIMVDKNGTYIFTVSGFALDRFKADVYGKSRIEDMKEKEKNATAEEVISFLSDKFCVYSEGNKQYTAKEKAEYGLPEQSDGQELLDLLHVRYALSLQAYQKYLPVTVARDISQETVAGIMENQSELLGVDISEDSIRVYEGGEACSSILGYTGVISSEELTKKKETGYTINSIVGKSGLEQYLDSVLQGRNGKKEVYVDSMGRVMEDLGVIEEPQAGKDVYLSIDADLQQKTYDALERKLADILLQNLVNAKTFDKETINDTTEIKIPVYDAYIALLNNGVIDLEQFQEKDASELEKEIYQSCLNKKNQVIEKIEKQLTQTPVKYKDLGKEMQEYQRLIIDSLDMIDEEKMEKDLELLKNWEKGELSISEYLHGMIGEGCINSGIFDSEEQYLQQDEMYQLLVSYIAEELQSNMEFEELIYRYMVLNNEISPEQIFMVLYEQGVLDRQDGDFEKWQREALSTYGLMVQKIQKLEITPADLALDPCSGSAVVTDTKTGKVLACVSYPGYDNNRLANQMDNNYYYKIYNNASIPLYNRATQQLSAPGSTFKPITIIAGLEEGVIENSTTVMCDGVFDKVVPPLKCWNHAGHGSVTGVASALAHSCNDYLCEISYRLGMTGNNEFSDKQALEYIQDYAKLFDLDKKSGIELPESNPKITDQYAIPSAIGQGTNNFSTVQLGRYVTTLANQGTSFRLSLIDKMDGTETKPKKESTINLSVSTWNSVLAGMEKYAKNTGVFEGFPISVAGKSGTAQESKTRPDHGLFVGYAPAENPQIAVAVRITNGYVAGNAVECGREIFETYFKTENQ